MLKINKNNFFIYTLLFTVIIVSVYFYFFSKKNIHIKYIYEKVLASDVFETFKDYENLKKLNDLHVKEFGENIINISGYQLYANELLSKIIRFLENNKNYKYEYKNIKKLSATEFKKLEKILNNLSLEGAYFLNPEHIDKITINLYLSKKDDEKIFLEYFRYIVENEILKSFVTNEIKIEKHLKNITEKKYINLMRHNHYHFLDSLRMVFKFNEINKELHKSLVFIPEESIQKINEVILLYNFDDIIFELECPFTQLLEKNSCKIISENTIKTLLVFYEKLKKIKWIDPKYPRSHNAFNYLLNAWAFDQKLLSNNLMLDILNLSFKEKNIKNLASESRFQKEKNNLNENYDFRNFEVKYYDIEKMIDKFSDIKKAETNSNHLEFLSYLVFAIMFSFVSHIIYRSFLKN